MNYDGKNWFFTHDDGAYSDPAPSYAEMLGYYAVIGLVVGGSILAVLWLS